MRDRPLAHPRRRLSPVHVRQVSNGLAGIRNFTPDTSQLHPIPVDTWGPLVFLNWGEEQLPPLEEVLGAGGKQLEAEGLKSDDWVFYKRVDHPMACKCAPPAYPGWWGERRCAGM